MIWEAVILGLLGWVGRFLLTVPNPTRDEFGNIMDPVGGTRLKNWIGYLMAVIAKKRETASANSCTVDVIEKFHKPEPHPYFNESYYYNGCDAKSGDRIITRISRRGEAGKKTYVFLLLDLTKYGALALEEDNVPAEISKENPAAMGVEYICIEPMLKWRVKYKGKLRKKCDPPKVVRQGKNEYVDVELDLIYETDTPRFWYMRDDCAETLGNNLSQEPWGMQFLKVCLKRSKNHGHYEDYGRLKGKISVNGEAPEEYDFGTFRDHSWDIRRWQAMDHLFILLVAFKEPLRLFGHDYYYLDVTLVSMPDNSSGVARYSTGYILPRLKDEKAPKLVMTCGTSINDIPFKTLPDGSREPMAEHDIVMMVRPEPCHELSGSMAKPVAVRIKMDGPIRTLLYYPDDGDFKVFEDSLNFTITNTITHQSVQGYGTRQSGFRCGEYDPSTGGCG